MHRYALSVLAIVFLVAAEDSKDEAIKKELAKMKGTWKAVSLEIDGNKPIPDDMLEKLQCVIDADGKGTVQFDGATILAATNKIDPTKKPKTLDATFTEGDMKGETSLAIYELKDDTLKYCRATPGKDRPTEFSSKPGSGQTLVVYKRAKAQ